MSATAAARSHPMDARSKPDKVPLPQWFTSELDRDGYMAVPITAIENLHRKFDRVASSVYLMLLRLTVGNYRQNRPQKVRVTREEFAEWARCDVRQVTNALAFLRAKKVIESEGEGKSVIYWITDFSLAGLPDLDERTVDRDRTKPAPPAGKPWLLGHGGRWKSRLEEPTTIEEISYRHEGAEIEVRHEIKGAQIEVITKCRSNPVKDLPSEPGTRVPGRPLEDALSPIFLERFHHEPDAILLKRIAAQLKATPIPYYIHGVVLPKLKKSKHVSTGLFINLATEATDKWAKLPAELRQAYLPAAPKAVPTTVAVHEPEDSGSPWMQIRLAIKVGIPSEDYQNWVANTAFAALKHGELVVRVPDQVTAEFLAQEFGAKIIDLAATLGLAVDRVRWLPPEEGEC